MAVTSQPLVSGSSAPRRDFSLTLAGIGGALALLPFLIIVLAVNGGYSVAGLEVLAGKFNGAGRLFWSLASALHFNIPQAALLGLPIAQPVLPWLGVLGTSLLQIVIIYRKIVGKSIHWKLWAAAIIVSAYDYISTWFGLGEASWLQAAWFVVPLVLAFIITFLFETIIGFIISLLWPKKN